jgi:NAD(P)-dependent dehydrogenase (short-subunit alcohol dehydrogenase family)
MSFVRARLRRKIEESTTQRHSKAAEIPAEYPEGNIPLTSGDPGTSQEVAELVLFLASERSRHITGTPVWIDGGQSLLV